MYPGSASTRNIPARETQVLPFKDKEGMETAAAPVRMIPDVNISETTEQYLIIMATPGLKRGDFNIETAGSIMTISAKKEADPLSCVDDRREYDYGDWTRAFTLPGDADALLAGAEYKNGELIIHMPRNSSSENQAKATIYVY